MHQKRPVSEVEIYVPESLLAISKIIESLRYWWLIERGKTGKTIRELEGAFAEG
jgi:hypothetical protein